MKCVRYTYSVFVALHDLMHDFNNEGRKKTEPRANTHSLQSNNRKYHKLNNARVMKLDTLAKLKRDTICVGCTYRH